MTPAFGGQYSIQLSYGCVGVDLAMRRLCGKVALSGERVEKASQPRVELLAGRPDDHADVARRDVVLFA